MPFKYRRLPGGNGQFRDYVIRQPKELSIGKRHTWSIHPSIYPPPAGKLLKCLKDTSMCSKLKLCNAVDVDTRTLYAIVCLIPR